MKRTKQTIGLLFITLLIAFILCSCAGVKYGCPNNVAAWEKRVKFNK
jgi:hypothetical protein